MIAQEGTPRELYEAPASAFVADFIGEANIVTGRLTEATGDMGAVEIAGHVVRVPHRGHAPGAVRLAIRPDALRLDSGPAGVGLAGRVLRAAFVGRVVEYSIETAAGELFAVAPGTEPAVAPGQAVRLAVGPRGVALVD